MATMQSAPLALKASTPCCRSLLVEVHGKDEVVIAFFFDAVDIFKFDIITEYRKGLIDIIIFFASDGIFRQGLKDIAVDRTCGTIGDIQHSLLDRLTDTDPGAIYGNSAKQDAGDQKDPLNHKYDLSGKLIPRRHEAYSSHGKQFTHLMNTIIVS